MQGWVYILKCADGRYYVGSYRGHDIGVRVAEHNSGKHPQAWTCSRRPVELAWADWFGTIEQAVQFERRLKGWSRAKKEAVIRGDWSALPELARGRGAASSFDGLRMRLIQIAGKASC
ncbi:MAG: GIY-YIG nuclease family protein [Hyphomonadaceae bacterium]